MTSGYDELAQEVVDSHQMWRASARTQVDGLDKRLLAIEVLLQEPDDISDGLERQPRHAPAGMTMTRR